MQNRIDQYIESHVAIINGVNVISIAEQNKFIVDEKADLPVNGTCFIEGNQDSGDDEINVEYTLLKYEAPNALYQFRIV